MTILRRCYAPDDARGGGGDPRDPRRGRSDDPSESLWSHGAPRRDMPPLEPPEHDASRDAAQDGIETDLGAPPLAPASDDYREAQRARDPELLRSAPGQRPENVAPSASGFGENSDDPATPRRTFIARPGDALPPPSPMEKPASPERRAEGLKLSEDDDPARHGAGDARHRGAHPRHRKSHPHEPRRQEARESKFIFFQARNGVLEWLLALLLGALATASVVLTYPGFGQTWDEALYMRGATRAAEYVQKLSLGDFSVLSSEQIDAHWGKTIDGNDPLHPEVAAVPKLVTGAGLLTLEPRGYSPLIAARIPVAIFFGLTVAMLFLIGNRIHRRVGGFAAAILYASAPRVWGHAHLAASETLAAFSAVLLVWMLLACLSRKWMVVGVAVALGLAFNTKVTLVLLPSAMAVWLMLYAWRRIPPLALAVLVATPLTIYLTWPMLWASPYARIVEYFEFYLSHQKTAVYYLGQIWGYVHGPPAPWHYPFVITAVSLPEWFLLFLLVGIGAALGGVLKRPVPVLFLLLALVPMGVAALPNSPKYDGERLFFIAFPFLALVAAGGFAALHNAMFRNHYASDRPGFRFKTSLPMVGLILVMGAADNWIAYPGQLNWFNRTVGGSVGARGLGFESSYWHEAVNQRVFDWMNNNIKPGESVKALSMNAMVLENAQKWGMLRNDIVLNKPEPPYDYYLLQVREGMFSRVERTLHYQRRPVANFTVQDVARVQIFRGSAIALTPEQRPTDILAVGEVYTDADVDLSQRVAPATDSATTATQAAQPPAPVDADTPPAPAPTPTPQPTPAPTPSPTPGTLADVNALPVPATAIVQTPSPPRIPRADVEPPAIFRRDETTAPQ